RPAPRGGMPSSPRSPSTSRITTGSRSRDGPGVGTASSAPGGSCPTCRRSGRPRSPRARRPSGAAGSSSPMISFPVPDAVPRDEFLDALRSLGEKLHRPATTADIYVFGGAAMVIGYHARPATRDIDAVFAPDTEVLEASAEVARERKWPRSWLNNQ